MIELRVKNVLFCSQVECSTQNSNNASNLKPQHLKCEICKFVRERVCVSEFICVPHYALLKMPKEWKDCTDWSEKLYMRMRVYVCVCVIIVLTKEHTQVSYEMQFHFCALYVNMLYVNLCVRLCQTLCPRFTGCFLLLECHALGHCPTGWYSLHVAISLALTHSLSRSLACIASHRCKSVKSAWNFSRLYR